MLFLRNLDGYLKALSKNNKRDIQRKPTLASPSQFGDSCTKLSKIDNYFIKATSQFKSYKEISDSDQSLDEFSDLKKNMSSSEFTSEIHSNSVNPPHISHRDRNQRACIKVENLEDNKALKSSAISSINVNNETECEKQPI